MNLELVPHTDILSIPSNELEGMTIVSKMQMIKNIRNYIGMLRDSWARSGYSDDQIPAAEKDNLEQAEKIGIKIFEGMGFPSTYWDNCQIELERTKNLIQQDLVIQFASQNWGALSLVEKKLILQKAVNIFASEQSKLSPIKIMAGQIEWVENVSFEGNSPADFKQSPNTYKIELNSDKNCQLESNFYLALKCSLHEQIHVKNTCYAHAYYIDQLPMSFNNVGIYFTLQPEIYIPSFRSNRLWAAQLGEREALGANSLDIKFE
jgi:hypothetical protein